MVKKFNGVPSLKLIILCAQFCRASEIPSSFAAVPVASFPDEDACHPEPDKKLAQYIVGYGSLMETASKNQTHKNTGDNIPVLVHGFCREWSLKGEDVGPDLTYLGVVPGNDCNFNGVIFKLPSTTTTTTTALQRYDERESYYCRHSVDERDIRVLGHNGTGGQTPNGQFWIYVNKPEYRDWPTKNFPIVQSYVDIFISGCLELEEKFELSNFAKDCVKSTKGWSRDFWVNDRIFPRRPFIHQPRATKIDSVLSEEVPQEFENIKIEGYCVR